MSPTPASRRSRAAAVLASHTLRPLGEIVPANAAGVAFTRQLIAGAMALAGPPPRGTQISSVDVLTPAGRVRGEWVRGPGAHRWDGCVFYVHGSGYAICSPKTHRGLTARISTHTGLPVFAVDYRLAPQHRFPTAADDVMAAWSWLTGTQHPASRVVVAADSAGGHLSLDLCLALLRSGARPEAELPAALALMSPLVDLSFATGAARERLRPDPLLGSGPARRLVRHYIRDADPCDARLAHVLAEGERLPPTLIQAGGAEMLAADAHRLHRMLRAAGGDSTLEVWPGQLHVFQALPRIVPEADPALRRLTGFLADALPRTTTTGRRRRIA